MTPSDILLYLYISVYSVTIREGLLCSRWEQIHRLTAMYYYIKFLTSEPREPSERGDNRSVGARVDGGQGSVIQLSKAHRSSQILKQQAKGLQDLHHVLCICVIAFSLRFLALLSIRKSGALSLVPALVTLFLLWSCFFLLYFVLPYLVVISFLEACSFF